MQRIYVRYQDWEDYQHGMWRKVSNEDEWLQRAIKFTGNHKRYGSWMKKVIYKWPATMLHNLTNPSLNQRAFVGHCACCLAFGCPEYIVRMAWKELTEKQRVLADKVAQETIDEWKEKYRNTLTSGKNGAIMKEYQMKLL